MRRVEICGGIATGKSNVIAAEAFAHGDLRTLSNDQTERIRRKMQSIVAQHLAGSEGQITFEEGYPRATPIRINLRSPRPTRDWQVSLLKGGV